MLAVMSCKISFLAQSLMVV